MKILDCTFRDGGYYTNWDFSDSIVETYCDAIAGLPVDTIEIGYRSKPLKGYNGKYFHCPDFVIDNLRSRLPGKSLAVMLNEKDCTPEVVRSLIAPIQGRVDVIRFAVDPERLGNMPALLAVCKELGFATATNLMYASNYRDNVEGLISAVSGLTDCDFLNLVDSYGGLYPHEVSRMVGALKSEISCELGYHGHDNMELAFANALAAVEAGATWLDATVTGMGRGAGNLKTELVLTHMASSDPAGVNLDLLSSVVSAFEELRIQYGWGTNLPYMLSGAASLPQKDVMDWVTKRYYSMNAIVRALENQREGQRDNLHLPAWNSPETSSPEVLLVGGGYSVSEQGAALLKWLEIKGGIPVVHSSRSSRNPSVLKDAASKRYFCLAGNEGSRLQPALGEVLNADSLCVLPPYPRPMGTALPKSFENQACELPAIDIAAGFAGSTTAVALQTAILLGAKTIWVVGYDGYLSAKVDTRERELFQENEALFAAAAARGIELRSLTPTGYSALTADSVYGYLS